MDDWVEKLVITVNPYNLTREQLTIRLYLDNLNINLHAARHAAKQILEEKPKVIINAKK